LDPVRFEFDGDSDCYFAARARDFTFSKGAAAIIGADMIVTMFAGEEQWGMFFSTRELLDPETLKWLKDSDHLLEDEWKAAESLAKKAEQLASQARVSALKAREASLSANDFQVVMVEIERKPIFAALPETVEVHPVFSQINREVDFDCNWD